MYPKESQATSEGIFVSEDFPEEWVDRRKVLKPIFNAAKRMENLKDKTHLLKDSLVINGRAFTVSPENNLSEISNVIDITTTCQREASSGDLTAFLGTHLPYSNLYPSEFKLNNITYSCAKQFIQRRPCCSMMIRLTPIS